MDGSHNDTEFYNEFCQETRMFLNVKCLFYFSKATSLNMINFNPCFLFDSSLLLRSNHTCITIPCVKTLKFKDLLESIL